jgi:2-oxoglutarate ferredoxin oxidoreductase subunit beta
LQKLRADYDPSSRSAAYRAIEESRASGMILTGLLYIDPSALDFTAQEHLPLAPLKDLKEETLRLTREQFAQLMAEFA